MPSKISISYESCHPCKFYRDHLFKSGLNPIYHAYCNHPDKIEQDPLFGGSKGAFIGKNTERRPAWCPLRGNPEAEKEAAESEE